jgi:pSer/pThr/pTyr-binding forkhead associated (FHA) protein
MTNPESNISSYTLIGIEGWFTGETFHTSGDNTLIGRSPGCQIQIEDPAVSKQHARLFFSEGKWFVEDLNSSNGTYVNSHLIQKPKILKPKDIIRFGTHSFRFFPGPPESIPKPVKLLSKKWTWLFVAGCLLLGLAGLIIMLINLLS